MKTTINGHEIEGTPEEIARMIGLTPDENRVATNGSIDFGNIADWGFIRRIDYEKVQSNIQFRKA